jgi:hypothetical protein
MADDLGNIEIGVVFRDRGDGMKKAVTVAERLEKQLQRLVKSANEGSISQERFRQKLVIAGRELKKNSDMTGNQAYGSVIKYTNAIRKQQEAQESLTNSFVRQQSVVKSAYVAQEALGKGMNRTGVIAQQAGYQFGDFFVQVQSGTNVMVAFGQQATQLIGTFAMLAKSTRAIMLLSGLGVVVPILTAIAAGIMRTKEAAEGAEEKVKTFEDRLRSSQTAIDSAQNSVVNLTDKGLENLREKFGAVTKEVIALEDRLNRIELKAMTTEIQEAMNSLFSPEFFSAIEDKFGAIGSAIAESTTEEIEFTRQEIKYLEQTIQNSDFAMPELEGQLVTLREELAAMTGDFENMGSLKDELTLSFRTIEAYKELEKTIKSATAEGNFQAAADGISKMLLLFEGVGIEIDSGALANMSRLEAILREAVATLDDAGPLALTLSEYFGDAADEAQRMALNLQQAAMSAEQTAEGNITVMVAQMRALNAGQDEYIAGARARLNLEKAAYQESLVAAGLSVKEAQLATESNFKHRDAALETTEAYRELQDSLKEVGKKGPKSAKDTRTAYEKAMMTAQEFADALDQQVLRAVDGVADAFSDFLAGGLRDFKSFVGSIKDMFVRLLADMAAMAIKRKILIPIAAGVAGGLGSSAAAGTAGGIVAGGGIGATLAAGAFGLGQGVSAALGMGGFTSAGLFNVSANAAVATAAGASPMMATIGAAIPPLIAVAAVIGLLTKKTKVLDTGLRATVKGFDVAIQTFQLTQTSRLFGLLKGKKVTSYGAAPAEIADPIIEAIGGIQQGILDAAKSLGIGSGLFEEFSYKFQLSLRGLTEEQKMEKLNAELSKMGDAFASLSGHFETMNELLAAAQQRYELETRLLGLLNDQSALLTRQREVERASVHELNQGTLTQIYALEDAYGAVNSAFATVQRSIEARKTKITEDFSDIMDAIQGRIQAASDAVGVSRGILSSLEGAGDSGMTRVSGMAYLRSLRGASRITDQKKLDDALQAIADPSQDLYTNFVDYQRDFQDQTNLVRELEEKAKLQLSTDEKTLLQLQDEAQAAQDRYDGQIDKLDEQLEAAQAQLNALFGIDTSVKSVAEAISTLGSAINAAQAAQATAKASTAAATGGGSKAVAQFGGDVGLLEKYDVGKDYVGKTGTYDYIKLTGEKQLLDAASMVGVATEGKTGQQISQDIANAGYVAVKLDEATKAMTFGGEESSSKNAFRSAIDRMLGKTRIIGYADGGMFGGGVRMVGERGPELEATGPSRIFSTKQTAELFRNPELVAEVKNLREEVAGLRSEQRQLQASNSKYVKRNYDINRKWDTEGLPATRT